MNYTFQIWPIHNLILDKMVGKTSLQDYFGAIQKPFSDPDFRSGMDVLADLRQVELEFGYEDARALANQISESPEMTYGKIAVVSTGTLNFGTIRMMGSAVEGKGVFSEYQVFKDYSEARNWLGLPEALELVI